MTARLPRVRIPPSPLIMRIIFLNSWYAKAGQSFYDFISQNSLEADIFCLSEVSPELFSRLKSSLHDFNGFYEKSFFDRNMGFVYGQATFIKKIFSFKILETIKIFRNVYNDLGFAMPCKVSVGNKSLYIINVHGKARPGHKLDTHARIRQSEKIIDFLLNKNGAKIVGGDFNLMPGTRSVKLFEKSDYKNLIKEFNIKETRNHLTWDQFPNEEKQHFADYCFVSSEVKVKNFEVPRNEISDHLPLILDFEI